MGAVQFLFGAGSANSGRRSLYASVLSRLRQLMISRMAKPEEVGAAYIAVWRGSIRAVVRLP